MGDMRSQIAACKLAGRRLDELFERYGRDTILAALDQIFRRRRKSPRRQKIVERYRGCAYTRRNLVGITMV